MTPKMALHLGKTNRARKLLGVPAPLHLTRHQDAPAGFVRDARVITTRGMRLVQDLRVGDRLITRGNGVIPVDHIEQQSLISKAVYVIAGTLGHYQTGRDSLLPAGQPVLVRDWRAQALGQRPEIIACAVHLIDGEFIRDIGFQPMTVYRVFCKKPQVLYADGMELVSADFSHSTVSPDQIFN